MGSKRMEEAPFRRSPPESAVTFGPRSGRNAPKLGPRRQTVSNVSPTPADRPEVKRTNTAVTPVLSYSPTSEAVASTPAASTLRPRPTLPPNQLEAKVVILGSQGVGKTSLVHRYTSGHFTLSSTPSTIGASFHTKKLIVDSVKVRLQLWDTAGQERTASTASGSTVSDTREQLDWDPTWDAVEVSEVSAKSDRGIEEVFLAVTKKLVEKRAQIEQERKQRERNSIFLSASDNGEPEADAITVNSWTCCG
uniref:Small GTPase-RAS protein n=1 Tax=Kalmanozyma brasiliensis (strain GHG001) TaxID=1365824 RepID=V5E9E2_KALBG